MNVRVNPNIVALVAFMSLTGFIFGSPVSEVEQFIRDTQTKSKQNHQADLPPLPVYHEYEPYVYQAGEKDPFKLKSFVRDAASSTRPENQQCESAECGDAPPVPHTPYFLEGFDLTALRMVGTVNVNKNRPAVLIATPDSGIQEARVGEYIGRNNGLILSIQPDHVVIQEKYKVPRGWQNRMATLELFN